MASGPAKMPKFRKHSIEEKRRRSKLRKERKKLAREYSEGAGRPSKSKKVTKISDREVVSNQSGEKRKSKTQEDEISSPRELDSSSSNVISRY